MRKCLLFLRRHLFFTILTLVLFLCFDLYLIASFFPAFGEFFATTVGAFLRIVSGFITSWLPFSLMELTVLAIPVVCVCLLVGGAAYLIFRIKRKKAKRLGRFLGILWKTSLASLLIGLSLFFTNHGINYYRYPLEELMELEGTVDEEVLFETLSWVTDELKKCEGSVEFDESGASVCPYDFSLLAEKINNAYDDFSEDKPYLQSVGFDAKEVLTSEYMIYTHISGIYCPYTGESNVNTAYPDFVVADTIAHEYAHQRGIAPEDECNFLAFAVNVSSDDPYLRYAALASAFSSLGSEAAWLDDERYAEIYADCPAFVRGEYRAYSEYFQKYAHNTAADVAGSLNDEYLKLNGQTEGVLSYQMDARLICLYYLSNIR